MRPKVHQPTVPNPPDGSSTEADFDLLSFEDGETEGDEGLLDRDDVFGGHEGGNPVVGDFNDCWDKEKKEQQQLELEKQKRPKIKKQGQIGKYH